MVGKPSTTHRLDALEGELLRAINSLRLHCVSMGFPAPA
jgi:hypothetical protein